MKNEKKILLKIGLRIKEERDKQNISQEELANLSDLDRSYLGAVERGERNVGLITLMKITSALRIKIEDLLSDLNE